jgi:penicillin-binding protein 2
MSRALQVSCNAYFINLGMKLDTKSTLAFLQNLGLGSPSQLAPGIETQRGNLPEAADFINPAAKASFSFGQGASMVTPLQMACTVASIANGGTSVTPRLVMGETADGSTLINPTAIYTANRVISEKTAKAVQKMMVELSTRGAGAPQSPPGRSGRKDLLGADRPHDRRRGGGARMVRGLLSRGKAALQHRCVRRGRRLGRKRGRPDL